MHKREQISKNLSNTKNVILGLIQSYLDKCLKKSRVLECVKKF